MFNLKKVKWLEEQNASYKALHSNFIMEIDFLTRNVNDLQLKIKKLESQLQVRDSKGRYAKKHK